MEVKKYLFEQHGDKRGMLVALEQYKDIPFQIKYVYYMYDTRAEIASGFCVKKEVQQVLICISGSCNVLMDNGTDRKVVMLERPYEGLYVPGDLWLKIYGFSEKTVLLVLASEHYKNEDCICNYEQFLTRKLR